MKYMYDDAFHCKERVFLIAPVIFEVLSWVIVSSKAIWMHAVALHSLPGSLVFPESLPKWVGTRCLHNPFGIKEPNPRAQGLGLLRRDLGNLVEMETKFFSLPRGDEENFFLFPHFLPNSPE